MPQTGINLAQQLNAFNVSLLQRLPARDRVLIENAATNLRADVGARVFLKAGEPAPDFALPDQHGGSIRLSERLARGPVVVLFIRGGWCPFCTLTVRAYQACLPAIHDAGGDLLAITPQRADSCSVMAERDLLAFPTLSDQDNRVAEAYGIAYDLDPGLRSFYLRLGHDLPRVNGTGNWRVPLPATFIIGQDGRVVLADVAPQIYCRLEPAAAVNALQALSVQA
jgi:peroxiredoxin